MSEEKINGVMIYRDNETHCFWAVCEQLGILISGKSIRELMINLKDEIDVIDRNIVGENDERLTDKAQEIKQNWLLSY